MDPFNQRIKNTTGNNVTPITASIQTLKIIILDLYRFQKSNKQPINSQKEINKIKDNYPSHTPIYSNGSKHESTTGCTAICYKKII